MTDHQAKTVSLLVVRKRLFRKALARRWREERQRMRDAHYLLGFRGSDFIEPPSGHSFIHANYARLYV